MELNLKVLAWETNLLQPKDTRYSFIMKSDTDLNL